MSGYSHRDGQQCYTAVPVAAANKFSTAGDSMPQNLIAAKA